MRTGSPTKMSDRLSAYLDGALSETERREVEALVAADPVLAAELEELRRVDAALAEGFAEMLAAPVPLQLARAVEVYAPSAAASARLGGMRSLAAALALLAIGAALGSSVTRTLWPPLQVARDQPDWLEQVAEYHAVYSAQGRHLVEVPASDRAHLEGWLSGQIGVPFTVPDLSASGLEFRGGRLLVADGQPVAQLMYTDATGAVVAICFMRGGDGRPDTGEGSFAARRIGGFDLVSWEDRGALYVVIGPVGRQDLRQIAEAGARAL